jgi:predicted anti-sigma-YlaC factor YlaD
VKNDRLKNDLHGGDAEHERARMLIALSDLETSAAERAWLNAHLEACSSCRDFAETSRETVSALRSVSVTASRSLVSATQARIRRRAFELQRHRERMWVIGVCCFAVTLGSAVSIAALWGGLAWMGQQARLSDPLWQIGLMALGTMPAVVVGLVMLARGTYMADHNGTFQG